METKKLFTYFFAFVLTMAIYHFAAILMSEADTFLNLLGLFAGFTYLVILIKTNFFTKNIFKNFFNKQ
jgi:hypothetical protein